MPTRRPTTARPPGVDAWPWSRTDALVAAGAATLDLLGYTVGGLDRDPPVTAMGLLLFVVAALPLLGQRRRPVAALTGTLTLNLLLDLAVPVPHHFGCSASVALFTVARTQRARVITVAALATAGVTLVDYGPNMDMSSARVTSSVIAAALVVAAGFGFNHWQRQLETNRTLLADQALAQERRRIARELHDIVAHHLTTMQLMAGGARANLGGDVEVVRDALVTLEESGRLALREMRQLLDVLRADDEPAGKPAAAAPDAPQPGVGELQRIVDDSRQAGLPTEFSVRGTERPLPPVTGLTVFRIVQEALTNARKHAGGAHARVELTYHQDRVTVTVRDNGSGTDAPSSGRRGGYGLIGMRERVALHGGTLDVGGLDGGGFQVAATLPLAAHIGEERQG
ncbi:signal transduction histidine kinase [Kitasatospora sp. GP30]|uniref:sensor histidine kinase n=1 Tax=Kitasatospora sp. GP30 TaxID=3035084 RepID=UPI000C7016C9|nr:sensor histidine kinase [Kitasatospora sp. GP30]MDH6145217.1 signal transduction histidine kinase [Kitasatospora sp. GP30]